MSYLAKQLQSYKTKWLPADIVFIMDALANSTLAMQYHDMLTRLGLDPSAVNVVISLMEVVRIGYLLYEKKAEESSEAPPPSP